MALEMLCLLEPAVTDGTFSEDHVEANASQSAGHDEPLRIHAHEWKGSGIEEIEASGAGRGTRS